MSHLVKINMQVKNIKALEKAAKKLGLTFNKGVKSFQYYGSSSSTCEHTISNKGDRYAVGVCAVPGKKEFELKWDPDYLGAAQSKIGHNATALKQEYAVQVATMEAEGQGMFVTRYDQKDGTVRLEAQYQ